MMKATDPKNSPDPVSRLSNEEIETDKDGNLMSAREDYSGNDDHQPNSGIDNQGRSLRKKDQKRGGTPHLGLED